MFDPTILANGPYVLRLTATDLAGSTESSEQIVNVSGNLKLGNFRLSFTDLVVPVAGIPITEQIVLDYCRSGHVTPQGLTEARNECAARLAELGKRLRGRRA